MVISLSCAVGSGSSFRNLEGDNQPAICKRVTESEKSKRKGFKETDLSLQMKVVGFFNRFSTLSVVSRGVGFLSSARDPTTEVCPLGI